MIVECQSVFSFCELIHELCCMQVERDDKG
jgi:hypothetical protein